MLKICVGLMMLSSINAFAKGYCKNQVTAAINAIDEINHPKSNREINLKMTGYSGFHQKVYEGTVTNNLSSEERKYTVNVFEFEDPNGFPCKIDSVKSF